MQALGTAFASDYDGTLCQSNWETGEESFEPATLDAVRHYQEAGGLFGVCTGRPLFSVVEGLRGIVEPDFYIVTTGAQVVDRGQRVLFEQTIDRAVAQKIYELYASEEMSLLAVTDTGFYSIGRVFAPQIPAVGSLDEVDGKLLGVSLESHANELLAHRTCIDLNRRFGNVVEGFQNLGSVDVVGKGCSKGSGVEIIRNAFGLSCVIGIGDSYNDLPLLGAADVAYTFHASPQVVRDAATHVVDNLAQAIDHFMTQTL